MPGYMDPLGDLPSSADDDSDFDDADVTENLRVALPKEAPVAAPRKEITFEDLKAVGYKGAASLSTIKDPKSGGGGGKWGWSQGTTAQRHEDDFEDLHHKTNAGLEEATGAMLRAAAESKRKREDDQAERAAARDQRIKLEQEARDALKADNQLKRDARKQGGFQQKEKRKRVLGMQKSGGKDFVQDEKRQLRDAGGGFGFD